MSTNLTSHHTRPTGYEARRIESTMEAYKNDIATAQCTEFCQALQGIGAADGKIPSHGELKGALGINGDGYLLGTFRELQKRKRCPFCQVLVEALSEAVITSAPDPEAAQVRITIRPGEHCLRLSHPLLHGTRILFVKDDAENIDAEQGPYVARAVEQEQVSASLVRSWLRQCEEKHGDSCFHLPLFLVSIPISKTILYHLF